MGVCCIVFDIDGMLFEFFMNFLNIEKKIILRFFFSIFHVFFAFHAISNIKTKIVGGGGVDFFFFEKQFFLISRFMLFSTLKTNIEKVPLHLLVKWEVVSPNSREGQLETISIILYYINSLVLILYLKCGGGLGGGGGCNFFLTF